VKTSLCLSHDELVDLTSYEQPSRILAELHRRGFHRAWRNRLGEVVLERAHYDAVCAGATQAARPQVRLIRKAA
jgi:hypothetical protein